MALDVGSRLAHYDVTALIGEGGMGQVYQATDTNLDRQVAIKVLPDAFSSDPDRLVAVGDPPALPGRPAPFDVSGSHVRNSFP